MSCIFVNYVLFKLLYLIIGFAISCSGVGSSDGVVMCLKSESEALLEFKQGLVDESNALTSWKSEKDCCKWRGITCNNQTSYVTGLNLSITYDADFKRVALPLRGDIHPSLLALRYLTVLDLSWNDFGGMMIPQFIGSLSHLKQLNLEQSNFSGHVPPHLGNLSKLHTLELSSNEYVSSENLEWLSHLSSLRYLSMSRLNLSKAVKWPQSLSKLTSLTELHLSSCDLPDIDLKSLSNLNSSTPLRYLDLSENWFNSSIFYWVANVSTSFEHIYLYYNELQGLIPLDIFRDMHSLVAVDLSFNHLQGGILKSLENLCSLESLFIFSNQFSENIEDFFKALACANNTLKSLYLSDNLFWGSLPNLASFSNLRDLSLESNNLTGSIPESVGQLSSLELLSFSNNFITGAITEALFQNLSRLQSLGLSGNNFSINFSSDWIPPFQLTERLDISHYRLGPKFPKWILTQTNITQLYLSNCGLSGSLPHEFWDTFSSSLQVLDLSENQLHGNLPNFSTTMLANLGLLDISSNLLWGMIPDCWSQFQRLASLHLDHNNLSGNLPNSLGHLQGLRILLLNDNNFSGELPSLENCTQLFMIDVGNNNLSGKIPTWIDQSLSKLVILRLRSNEFSGFIPVSLCGLGIIHVLDLSHNNISGALPHCFTNITTLADDFPLGYDMVVDLMWKGIEIEFGMNIWHLRFIDISNNCLVGEIPDGIINMQSLISLNLSRNRLTGKLPEMFGNMKSLESLDLSRNHISGHIPSSFSSLNFLQVLDLSNNQFSGRIPQSTQLQSFSASTYAGNLGLCGPPLSPNCPGDEPNQPTEDGNNKEYKDDDGLTSWGFIISLVLGFITGFWTVTGSLLLKKSWRHAYFGFLGNAQDWIYVKANVFKQKIWMQT